MNILLTLAYDGTNYCGWQKQKNGVSVQSVLEAALYSVFGAYTPTVGASRTDSGVHAMSQKVSFVVENSKIPAANLPKVINSKLPNDISVRDAELVAGGFNPRFRAVSKTYVYRILNDTYPNPLLRNYTWHVPRGLDAGLMAQAGGYFVGTRDFAAFAAAGNSHKTTVRTIYSLDITKEDTIISITVRGNAFLYNMIRIMAGTLAAVGVGKIPPERIPEIIVSGDREKAGQTAPPQGLTLLDITY
ncbi:tRNA pseudouridine synthase A [Clostridia bacterium]|nr:tRNA pseudouridine synthase A [Clostridia bacterium]